MSELWEIKRTTFLHTKKMKSFLAYLVLAILVFPLVLFCVSLPRTFAYPVQSSQLVGRWQVKFNLSGIGERNLIFDSQGKGIGSFILLDAGSGDKSEPVAQPAVWSETTNDRVSFSGDLELQLGNCCRETGTLIFKGKFDSPNSISGRAIFVGSTIDEENFNGFRSTVGSFSATRLAK